MSDRDTQRPLSLHHDVSCPKCSYNLRGLLSETVNCPECGTLCDTTVTSHNQERISSSFGTPGVIAALTAIGAFIAQAAIGLHGMFAATLIGGLLWLGVTYRLVSLVGLRNGCIGVMLSTIVAALTVLAIAALVLGIIFEWEMLPVAALTLLLLIASFMVASRIQTLVRAHSRSFALNLDTFEYGFGEVGLHGSVIRPHTSPSFLQETRATAPDDSSTRSILELDRTNFLAARYLVYYQGHTFGIAILNFSKARADVWLRPDFRFRLEYRNHQFALLSLSDNTVLCRARFMSEDLAWHLYLSECHAVLREDHMIIDGETEEILPVTIDTKDDIVNTSLVSIRWDTGSLQLFDGLFIAVLEVQSRR